MGEGTLWRGREMGTSIKRHPIEIRFSPFSLLCLFFIWLGVSALAFYVGILVGRMEQMREIRNAYSADERAVAEEESPFLSFEEALPAPDDGEGAERSSIVPKTRPPETVLEPTAESGSTGSTVIQIASFRNPEGAENLVQEMRKKGYRCFLRTPDRSGADGGYCRVFVGPLPSAEMAVRIKEHLEQQEGYKNTLILSVGKKEE